MNLRPPPPTRCRPEASCRGMGAAMTASAAAPIAGVSLAVPRPRTLSPVVVPGPKAMSALAAPASPEGPRHARYARHERSTVVVPASMSASAARIGVSLAPRKVNCRGTGVDVSASAARLACPSRPFARTLSPVVVLARPCSP